MFVPFGWTHVLFAGLPIIGLGFLAGSRVERTCEEYSRITNSSGLNGVDLARRILAGAGLNDVTVRVVDYELSDYYDPLTRTLNLSRNIATSASVASEAVVAHEIGHAQQDRQGYFAMRWRSGLVPAANVGFEAAAVVVFAGALLSVVTHASFGFYVALGGLILLAAVVAFQLITTSLEVDASRRALRLLADTGVIPAEERAGARRMLRAAAFTYWVALFGSVFALPYYALAVFGIRRDEH